MNGSKLTTMTTAEIRDACEHGTDQSDWERVRREATAGIEPAEDLDSPIAAKLMQKEIARIKRGRVLGSGTKSSTTVRFDNDILAAFKATGKGWQTKLNNALRDWLKTHSPA